MSYSLLHQAQEDESSMSAGPSVESEDELVEIKSEVVPVGAALVGAEHPALEERRHSMCARQHDGRLGSWGRLCIQGVEATRSSNVRVETVAMNRRAWRNVGDQELTQGRVVDAVDDAHSATPEPTGLVPLDRHDDRQFRPVLTTPALAGSPAPIEGLIDFDVARQQIASRVDRHSPQLGEHRPGRLVTPESELSLEGHRRDTVLARCEQPGGVEPDCQGCACPVKDSAGRDTGTRMARGALVAPVPVEPSRGSTVLASETVGPSKPPQVVKTVSVLREPRTELAKVCRVVLMGTRCDQHTETLPRNSQIYSG